MTKLARQKHQQKPVHSSFINGNFNHTEKSMFETLLSPAGIALVTSLAAPIGTWVVQSSLTLAQSYAETETNSFIKKFFRRRITEKQLQDTFSRSVQATLDDTQLSLTPEMRAELVGTQGQFRKFSKFVDHYHQLADLSHQERRKKAQQILRDYIHRYAPSVSDEVLNTIETHFSEAAFEIIRDSIKTSPEVFCHEALASLQRIEAELQRTATEIDAITKNQEILRASTEYYQTFAPDREEFQTRLEQIATTLGEIRGSQEDLARGLERVQDGIDDLQRSVQATLGKSRDYAVLTGELAELEEFFSAIPEANTSTREKIRTKIKEKKAEIEVFTQDVLRLAETLRNRPIDSERLREAQVYFEAGDFEKTRAVLDGAKLKADQDHLLSRKEESERELAALDASLRHNAMEFLVKAQATVLDLANPNRLSEAEEYFRDSIISMPMFSNLFDYAHFLQSRLRFDDAVAVYTRILDELREDLHPSNRADTLNNLANLHKNRNEYDAAEQEYTEALGIRRELAAADPAVYRPDVAMTLNNLAVLHAGRNQFDAAEEEYTEALGIRRELAAADPAAYRPYVAMTLYNLAILYATRNQFDAAEEEFTKALALYRELAAVNPMIYLSDVADTLDGLALIHDELHQHDRADEERAEATTIRQTLLPS